jgi:peptidyl-dipeptidase Dcp
MNPLLESFDTPFETPPFDKIKEEHFLPAIVEALKTAREEVKVIVDNPQSPNFENTIIALENTGEKVSRISEIFYNLNSAETNEEIQKIARDFSPLLSEYGNDIMLNPELFERVETVYKDDQSNLTEEQRMLLGKTYRAFRNNGALLSDGDKEKLRELDRDLTGLSLAFGENVLAETNDYELWLEDEGDLKGLPESAVEAAAEAAREKDREGAWLFTLHFPSYIPFMTYSAVRPLRERLFRAYGSRAFKENDHNNSGIIKEIVEKRKARAALLGFKSHAEYMLQERMAKSPTRVKEFLDELHQVAKPAATAELEELGAYAKKLDGLERVEKWDLAYYKEKLKQEKFQLDDEILKPYFQLEKVIEGAFEVARRLYGLSFALRDDIQKYHDDVRVYEVKDRDNQHLSVFYADFFPRPGKRNGAWMTSYRSQKVKNGKDIRPLVSIVCNFTKPTSNRPSLLTFNEVLTLFHEFGHALHGMLARGNYASLSGTSVFWDFVELPSQIMENWCYEKDCLDLFAHHYQSGEKIPEELVERLKGSATFMEGYATLRQVGLASLDLAWHTADPEKIDSVSEFEDNAIAEMDILPRVEGTNTSTSFSHIFQGGYSAGYYSYKWAEVLDADAFEYFSEAGIFNTEVSRKFEQLLSSGGSINPEQLYRQFRGRDADPAALLRRAGLAVQN